MELRALYEELETRLYGRAWTPAEIALGFVGDVGDLAKLVQAESGVRAISDSRAKLEHELADCLWSVLVLAEEFDVDLEAAFDRAMGELKGTIRGHLAE